jgi:23S rRNA pseudouridine1911/1915/1917 synthase
MNNAHCLVVSTIGEKQRLDVYLQRQFPQYSRSFFGDLCTHGKVKVNSIERSKNFKVANGDVIDANIELKIDEGNLTPENIPLDILYEDENIIAINKPMSMVVHPAVGSPNGTCKLQILYLRTCT